VLLLPAAAAFLVGLRTETIPSVVHESWRKTLSESNGINPVGSMCGVPKTSLFRSPLRSSFTMPKIVRTD
jgi:hypothetical protein